jgi:ssDNA-binding replication factor A large subunit
MEFGDERRRGRVLRTRIYDETGKVMVVFWDEWADRMKKVEKGECLRIVGGKIKKGRLGIEVHVDKMTSISVLKREIRKPLVRIGSLKEGMYGVDILAKVVDVRVGKVKTREGKVLRLARLLVGDQSGIAPMLFWEKHSELASSVRKGDVILSENCRVRDNRGILELVFTDDSSLVVNPDMPEVVALSQASITTAIGDLKKGLLGTIEGILIDSPRVQEVLTESGKPIKVATLKVTDGTGEIEVSLWRELVDKVRMLKEGDKIRMCCLRIIEERGKLKAVSSRWTHVESPSK